MNIFVSSTYEDLKEYRSAVRAAILELGHTPIMMEDFIPSGYLPKEECCRLVEKSYVFIGIYAHRYGYIPGGDRVSITEQEYLHAKKKLDK
ncbi:MAG: DUF4062 domain-containing protein, partial [bacterium]|nr:DUF4062 domain-containing protein [bacterium]